MGNGYVAVTSMPNVTVGTIADVDINDISKGTQTNDVKVTLDGESVPVVNVPTSTAAAISGHITITTHGTAQAGPDIDTPNGVLIKALSSNTGNVYVGNDGADDVASTNGWTMAAFDPPVVSYVSNLSDLYFDSAVDGEGFEWFKL